MAGSAEAQTLTAQQILSEYNLVARDFVTTNQDIEGGTVAGGNLNGATFFNNGEPKTPDIYVYGTLGAGPMNVGSYVNFYYSTPNVGNPQVNFNGGHTQYTTLPPVTQFTAPLDALSADFASVTKSTPGAEIVNGVFTAPAGYDGVVFFDLTASALESDLANHDVKFSGGAGVTGFIVNVSGDFAESSSTNFNTAQQDALFNFYNAKSVTLGNWKASVLAPDANLSIVNGFVDGSVFVNTFSGGGELHRDNLYNGSVDPPAVPEPSTWALLAAGFAGLGFVGYRRRRAAIAA